jgi:hypothetical protein
MLIRNGNRNEYTYLKVTDQRAGLEWNKIQQKMALNKVTKIEDTVTPRCNARTSSLWVALFFVPTTK